MPNENVSYRLHTMDMRNDEQEDEYDQEDALLQGDDDETGKRKRVYQNSDRTLIFLGIAGSLILTTLILALIYVLFGNVGHTSTPFDKTLALPKFGDIGCEFPGEAISPTLEQNLTLLEDSLEIVTTGRAIGDILFHTEPEDGKLEYVRLDVKLQGPRRDVLHAVYTRVREGRYELQTPETSEGCMRYTLEVWLPKHLTSLIIKTETLVHISFADMDMDSSIHQLDLRLAGDATDNLLILPEARIANAKYVLNNGFVEGTTLLYNTLKMESGQAQIDAEIVLMRDEESTETQYHDIDMTTTTRGLCRAVVKNPRHFTFRARHKSEAETEMVLLYPNSFAGELSMSTKTLSVRKADVEIPRDGIVYVGARGTIMSDLRVRNDLGSVYLSFDQ